MSSGHVAADELRLLIERYERLEEEKKNIADDMKDVLAEAKARGFDTKTMKDIIKLRKMTAEQRREREAMLDIYKAALGMLDGTPLGRWAVERVSKPEEQPEPAKQGDAAEAEAPEQEQPVASEPELTVDDARRMGGEAANAGMPVTANPFPARDARRAAWDEAWCQHLGSDGMDIPDALKPTPKKKGPSPDATAGDDE